MLSEGEKREHVKSGLKEKTAGRKHIKFEKRKRNTTLFLYRCVSLKEKRE